MSSKMIKNILKLLRIMSQIIDWMKENFMLAYWFMGMLICIALQLSAVFKAIIVWRWLMIILIVYSIIWGTICFVLSPIVKIIIRKLNSKFYNTYLKEQKEIKRKERGG